MTFDRCQSYILCISGVSQSIFMRVALMFIEFHHSFKVCKISSNQHIFYPTKVLLWKTTNYSYGSVLSPHAGSQSVNNLSSRHNPYREIHPRPFRPTRFVHSQPVLNVDMGSYQRARGAALASRWLNVSATWSRPLHGRTHDICALYQLKRTRAPYLERWAKKDKGGDEVFYDFRQC